MLSGSAITKRNGRNGKEERAEAVGTSEKKMQKKKTVK